MSDYYYVDGNKERKGPVPGSMLKNYGVTADSLVWTKGMANWTKARDVAELQDLFAASHVPPAIPGNQTLKTMIPGLDNELRKNLQFQRTSCENVITDIYSQFEDNDYMAFEMSIQRSGFATFENVYYADSSFNEENKKNLTPINITDSKTGLVLVCSLEDCINPENLSYFEPEDVEFYNTFLKRFEALPVFPQFTQHAENYEEIVNEETQKKAFRRTHYYAFDFGEDAEGAAQLVSDIINLDIEVNKLIFPDYCKDGKSKKYFFATNVGETHAAESRDGIDAANFAMPD